MADREETVAREDIELMIRDWQSECKDHPAMHNQANVLLSRLKDIRTTKHHRAASKIRLEIQSFQTGDDARFADGYREALAFALDALEPANTTFSSDDDAPEVTRRREDYYRRVASARAEAKEMGIERVIDRLIEHNPAYIRSLLETEDERFGEGALFDRYARTFCKVAPQ